MDDFFDITYAPNRAHSKRRAGYGEQTMLPGGLTATNQDFRCLHCRNLVSATPLLSGVFHRNHCPYCLYSRHMDLYKAGDRMAACKAEMRPIGLALKQARKKYVSPHQGELMLVHQCADCARLSLNRIAADDDNENILRIFAASQELPEVEWAALQAQGIRLLRPVERPIVQARLFGWAESAQN